MPEKSVFSQRNELPSVCKAHPRPTSPVDCQRALTAAAFHHTSGVSSHQRRFITPASFRYTSVVLLHQRRFVKGTTLVVPYNGEVQTGFSP
jgi:hypothetical protein